MELDSLLGENEQIKLRLLRYVQTKTGFITFDDIFLTIAISELRLKKIITEINEELQSIDSRVYIFFKKKMVWKKLDDMTIKKLRLSYFNKNPTFLLFKAYLEENISVQQFKNRIFLSTPTIYVKHKKVKEFLQKYGLTIRKGNIVGEELHVRNTIYLIFYEIFYGIENPFSITVRSKLNKLMNYLISLFQLKLRETEKIKFEIFLGIFLCRLEHNNYLNKNHDFFKLNLGEIKQLINNFRKSIFFKNTSILNEQIIIEIKYLLGFIKMLGVDNIPICMKEEKFKKIDYISQQITMQFVNIFQYKEAERKLSASLENEIKQINREGLVFENIFCCFKLNRYEKKIVDLYPMYSQCIRYVLSNYKGKILGILDQVRLDYLFYRYLFLLIDLVPFKYYFEPIYICIDFSLGKNYTKFIQKQFEHLQDLNIVVEQYLSSQTNIFISDIEFSNKSVKQIIWDKPFILDDWQLFINKLTKLVQEKKLLKLKFLDCE
ncbi:helix-turn-helix domain-containing protein [Enterococcus mundtii]|uniref:helix-turn-helix domain-containing protein n=1 Tax=Enterococcus TaxID=1350 RepID=UPI0032DEE0FF